MYKHHFIYIITNTSWNYDNICRFGYIYGNTTDLIQILSNNYLPFPSFFIKIWIVNITSQYKLSRIERLFSILSKNHWKINIVEDIYKVKHLSKSIRLFI